MIGINEKLNTIEAARAALSTDPNSKACGAGDDNLGNGQAS
jgi:hypothetical protein